MKILKPILIGLVALIVLLALIGLLLPSAAHVRTLRELSRRRPRRSTTSSTTCAASMSGRRGSRRTRRRAIPSAARNAASVPGSSGPVMTPRSAPARRKSSSLIPDQRVRAISTSAPQGAVTRFSTTRSGGARAHKLTWGFDTAPRQQHPGTVLRPGDGFDRWQLNMSMGSGKLKALAESAPVAAAAGETLKITEVDANAIDIAYVEGVTSLDPACNLQSVRPAAYSRIGQFMQSHALTQNGAPPSPVNRFYDESGWGFQAAIPVERE